MLFVELTEKEMRQLVLVSYRDWLVATLQIDSIAVPLFSNPNYSETGKLVYLQTAGVLSSQSDWIFPSTKSFFTVLKLQVHLPELYSQLMVGEGAEAQLDSSCVIVWVIP